MGTVIANFNAGMPSLPADLAAFFDENENITARASVPSLSYEGKTWTVSVDGNKKKLMGKNAEGDEVPLSIMRVVLLAYNPRRGRAFYEGTYDPTKVALPKCWSTHGVTPDDAVADKQAAECAKCPNAAKGSKVSDNGVETTACSQHRMLVLVPTNKVDFTPLRMKIAITSDYDGRSPDHEAAGWFSFSKYTEMLKANGVNHSALVSTKIKFDPNVAYPKLLFAKDDWVPEDKLRIILPVLKSDEVKALLDTTYTPNGADGVAQTAIASKPQGAASQQTRAPAKTTAQKTPPKQPDPPPPADEEDAAIDAGAFDMGPGEGDEPVVDNTPPAPPPKPAPRARTAAQKTQQTQAPAATQEPAATSSTPSNVESLLADWD